MQMLWLVAMVVVWRSLRQATGIAALRAHANPSRSSRSFGLSLDGCGKGMLHELPAAAENSSTHKKKAATQASRPAARPAARAT